MTGPHVDFDGFTEGAGPVRRANFTVQAGDASFIVTISVPASVFSQLDVAVRESREDRDLFRARLEMALAEFGRDYIQESFQDHDRVAAAARRGRWDHTIAGPDVARIRRLLRP